MGEASRSAASHAAAMPAEPRPPVPSGLSAQARADAKYHDQLRAAKRECERALAAIQAMDRQAIKAGGGPLWELFSGPVAAQFEDVASYQECLNVITVLAVEAGIESRASGSPGPSTAGPAPFLCAMPRSQEEQDAVAAAYLAVDAPPQAVLWESAAAAPGWERWYRCWSEGCSRRTLSTIHIAQDCPHFVCSVG